MAAAGRGARDGFSLIEAMMVMIIGGVALMLVFEIGGRAAATGFGLGGRALAVGDRQLAEDSLRSLIGGLQLAPAGGAAVHDHGDDFEGEATGFRGSIILDRPTICAPAGPGGTVVVRIEPSANGDRVTCQLGAEAPRLLLDLRPYRARFAYSGDGAAWTDRWRRDEGMSVGGGGIAHLREVYVRLAADKGGLVIVGHASSGRPALHQAPVSETPRGADL